MFNASSGQINILIISEISINCDILNKKLINSFPKVRKLDVALSHGTCSKF